MLIGAVDGPGGEAALFESFRGASAVVILDNCEHVVDAAAALAVRLLDAAPGVRVLCTSQVPLDVDGEVVFELAPLPLPTVSSCSPAAPRRSDREPRRARRTRDAVVDLCRSLDGLPLAIELAAARTRTLSVEEITRRLDDRVRRAGRPDQPQAGTPPVAAVDDRVELRPVVPRRPARPVGAGHVRRRRTAAGGGVRPRSPRRAGGRGDRRGRPARQPFAGDRRRPGTPVATSPSGGATGAVPAAGQHPRVRARGDGRRRAGRARPRRARRLVRRGRRLLHGRGAQCPPGRAPRVRPDRARQHRRGAGVGRRARPDAGAAHRRTGSAGPGSSSATAGARSGSWPRWRLPATRAAPGTGPTPCCSPRGSRRRPATSTSPAHHIAAAAELADAIDDADLRARCCYYLAYVVSHHGEFRAAIELTDRSRAIYDTMDRPWDQAANGAVRRSGGDLGR